MIPRPRRHAIRLPESWRTSPAAKIPGMLVSKGNGSRSAVQSCGRLASTMTSRPVRMNPWESRCDEIGQDPRPRRLPDKNKYRIGRNFARLTGSHVSQCNGFQPLISPDRLDNGPREDLDVERLHDSIRQGTGTWRRDFCRAPAR